MLEMNLRTTLSAKVGWKPDKTSMPIGPVITCRLCHNPRSVTMMGPKGICGNCTFTDYESPEARQAWVDGGVSKDDNENTSATWVECSIHTCRAQYVIYHPEALNVRPKCYYCREQSSISEDRRNKDPAPCLECKQCLSRVIVPKEYRTNDTSNYRCIACSTDRKTIVEVETSAKDLSKENTTSWLLENKKDKLKTPLGGRSVFYQINQAGTDGFCDQVVLFPNPDKQKLTIGGKLIHNTSDLIAQLKSWVSRRRTESGTCSLCFNDIRKADLNPACGRKSCEQRICRNCLSGWYGLNAAGRIINTAALSCPFCRRAPTAKTLHSYGMGIQAVGDLQEAVDNSGEWVYAWCVECSKAKQHVERVCAAGITRELTDWTCGGCEQLREEAAQRQIADLAAEIAELEAGDQRMNLERRNQARIEIDQARSTKKRTLNLKNCPHCTVLTEKKSGCGHMKCDCGGHWCWFCGVASNGGSIYSHMSKVHGGWYGSDSDDDNYDSGDDGDSEEDDD